MTSAQGFTERTGFGEVLESFAEESRAVLRDVHARAGFRGILPAEDAARLSAVLRVDIPRLMIELLPFAGLYAVPPISNFKVGAICRGATTGNLYYGANIEFVGQALSYCVHAEQSAVSNAWMEGELGIDFLAVSAAPCGYCRQFLNELLTAPSLVITVSGREPQSLAQLLPDSFGPRDLGIDGGLMQAGETPLSLPDSSSDPLIAAALAAARLSYAPYSKGFAAVALEARGEIIAGSYAENAAFNPSMSPMEVALSRLNLRGLTYADITRAVLVQEESSLCQQVHTTADVLGAVSSSVTLETHRAVRD